LRMKIEQFSCEPPDSFHAESIWIQNRKSARCNIDSQTGTGAHLEFAERIPNQYATFGQLFSPDTAGLNAGFELEQADLNLCMAQRLRSQMNGGQSLFTPSKDLLEILAVIRERTQLAILGYSSLAKVFSSDETVPEEVVDGEDDFVVLIRHWAEEVDSEGLETTGEDFASAVRLYLDATYELARMLEREAATRPINEVGFDRASRDWEVGQPR